MKYLLSVPLLVIPLAIYNVIMLFNTGVLASDASRLFAIALPSGTPWGPTTGELLVILGAFFLYIELFKATRTSSASVVDHMFSMFLFIIFLLEFLLVPACGTSAFFILMVLQLIDVIAGFTVTISGARRDFGVAG